MTSANIVQKLWNYCNVLRDDGMSYGDYVEAAPVRPAPAAFEHPGSAQLTYLLFLKIADERSKPPYAPAFGAHKYSSPVPAEYDWLILINKKNWSINKVLMSQRDHQECNA